MRNSQCFVCKKSYSVEILEMNQAVMLPVCYTCKGSEEENKSVDEYLDSLAEGFVCGCI